MTTNTTPVYMTDEDANLFLEMQKHRGFIDRLDELGFFKLSDCKVELLIDYTGRVGDIFIHQRHRGIVARE